MTRYLMVLLLSLGAPFAAMADDEERDSRSSNPPSTLSIDELPDYVINGARAAEPDVYFTSARRILWQDEPMYVLEGTQFKYKYKVYTNADGRVAHVTRDRRDDR
ncbi:MAG: hypothetical protein AAGA91_19360 [Pseudomonadota bacterium]